MDEEALLKIGGDLSQGIVDVIEIAAIERATRKHVAPDLVIQLRRSDSLF